MAERVTYGGQALIEGVLIRGVTHVSIAVRRPDGTIALSLEPVHPSFQGTLRRIPLVRGVLVLAEMLTVGTRALIFSARIATEEEGQDLPSFAIWTSLALSLAMGIGLFALGPVLAIQAIDPYLENLTGATAFSGSLLSNLVEGFIRLAFFIGYIALINLSSEVRRVFAYHGAEHMTVHAVENQCPLTIDQIRRFGRAHPRCGTAFILVVLIVAMLLFSLLGDPPLVWRFVSRIVLLPIVAGLGYELIRLGASRENSLIFRLLMAPGLKFQAMTTRIPDDSQIEVAIAAMVQARIAEGEVLEVEDAENGSVVHEQPCDDSR